MKKLLSLILAITMCISLLPTFASAEEAVQTTLKWELNRTAHTPASTSAKLAEFGYDAYSGAGLKWGYFEDNFRGTGIYPEGISLRELTSKMDGEGEFKAVTFELFIPDGGEFVPSAELGAMKSSPAWDFYLTEESAYNTLVAEKTTADERAKAVIDSQIAILTVDAYNKDVAGTANAYDSSLEWTSGTGEKLTLTVPESGAVYYLTVVSKTPDTRLTPYTASNNNYYALHIRSFTLTPVENPVQTWVFGYNAHNAELSDGSTVDVSHLTPSSGSVGMSFDSFNPENELSSSKWGVVDAYNWNGNSVRETYVYSNINVTGNAIKYAPGASIENSEYGAVTFKLQTEDGGAFIPSTDFYAGSDCPKWEVYLTKESDFNALSGSDYKSKIEKLSSSDRLFIIDAYSSTAGASDESATKESKEQSGVAIEIDGNSVYYLTFISNEGTETRTKPHRLDSSNRELSQFKLKSFTLTPVTDELTSTDEYKAMAAEKTAAEKAKTDEIADVSNDMVSATSKINIITASIHANDSDFIPATTQKEVTRGEEVTVTADKVEGYDFLYWRSGLGKDAKVITNANECTVKAAPGTWLTAVYKKTDSTDVSVLFYNADGEIVDNKLVAEGEEITLPELPTLAGYPASKGWALNTPENMIDTVTVKAEGNAMVFVAQFDEPTSGLYEVTVNGGATGGGSYAYGEEVTVTATERESGYGENVFAYWQKDGEVVSFDKSYTFNVSGACTLTPVYKFYNPKTDSLAKIILNDGLVEFIGLDSAVEKGVIFRDTDSDAVTLGNATHKIAMTTTGNHLSFNNDLENSGAANYTGYAILSNGSVIYDK